MIIPGYIFTTIFWPFDLLAKPLTIEHSLFFTHWDHMLNMVQPSLFYVKSEINLATTRHVH